MGLGVIYGFLRPLRPRLTGLADFLFLLAFGWGWVYLAFGICGGDLRLGYFCAMGAGAVLLDVLLGHHLTPMFVLFWNTLAKIGVKFLFPVKKILQFLKKWVASGKKSGKIKWNNRTLLRRASGGDPHGPIQKPFPRRQGGIHP